jgi:hypothetical protein
MLVNFGHTPAKAAEIAIDAGRGEQWALMWIATLCEVNARAILAKIAKEPANDQPDQ